MIDKFLSNLDCSVFFLIAVVTILFLICILVAIKKEDSEGCEYYTNSAGLRKFKNKSKKNINRGIFKT